MSLEAVIHRASTDPGFRKLLLSDPISALSAYRLTDEEKTALSAVQKSMKGGVRQLPVAAAEWD